MKSGQREAREKNFGRRVFARSSPTNFEPKETARALLIASTTQFLVKKQVTYPALPLV